MTTLTFTAEQLTIIDQALQQMPYGVVAPLIANINAQIQKTAVTEKLEPPHD